MRERWPQKEPILVDGSLVQLGDLTIVRHREGDPVRLESIPTGTLKLSIYRDEWPDQWQDFVKSPMKLVTTQFPKLVLCKGNRCGGTCAKHLPPVDTYLDLVILDLWSRSWQNLKGKKSIPRHPKSSSHTCSVGFLGTIVWEAYHKGCPSEKVFGTSEKSLLRRSLGFQIPSSSKGHWMYRGM